MAFFVIIAAAEAGVCVWLMWRLVQMEKLDRQRRDKLLDIRRSLDYVREKAYMAEKERDWFRDELERVKVELARAREEKKRADLRCVGASMELQKAAKPTLAESVKEVEIEEGAK